MPLLRRSDSLEALQCELKAAQKKAEELAAEIAKAQVSNVADQIKDANGVPVLVQKVNADSVDALRNWVTRCAIR